MLENLFGFNGQLGRLAFLLWSGVVALVVFAVILAFLLLGALLSLVLPPGGPGPQILGVLTGASALIVGIWATLALQARRLRDMGLNPLAWMVGVSAAMCADRWLLTYVTDLRFFPPFDQYTPLAGLVAAAYVIALVCWPPAEDAAPRPLALPDNRLEWN